MNKKACTCTSRIRLFFISLEFQTGYHKNILRGNKPWTQEIGVIHVYIFFYNKKYIPSTWQGTNRSHFGVFLNYHISLEVLLKTLQENYFWIISFFQSVRRHLSLQLNEPKQHITPGIDKNHPSNCIYCLKCAINGVECRKISLPISFKENSQLTWQF